MGIPSGLVKSTEHPSTTLIPRVSVYQVMQGLYDQKGEWVVGWTPKSDLKPFKRT